MLNTKPIKKSSNMFDNRIPNLSSDKKNTDNKVIQLTGSKQEELQNIVKQANEDIQSENNPNDMNNIEDRQIGGIGGDAHSNSQIQNPVVNREFTYDRYKDKNYNISNLIDGNKMFIGNVETQGINESQYKMELNPNQIQIQTNGFGETVKIYWDDVDNCYIITNMSSGTIECKIFNENVLKYIISNEINDIGIKRYLFIIGWNNQTEIFEFNFIDSVFTSNFNMMIKLQNWTYETLKTFDNIDESDTYNYQEAILMFYFQLVIYLFNNYEKYSLTNEPSKISRIYSSIVYRFSSLVLKNVLKIKNSINSNNVILNDLMLLRSDIFSQINFMNDKLEKYDKIINNKTETETETEIQTEIQTETEIDITDTSDKYETDSSKKSTNQTNSLILKKYEIINNNKKKLTETETENKINSDTSNKNISKMDYVNKNGKKIQKIKEFITDELQINTDDTYNSEEYDSEKNGYFEIDNAFADFDDIDDSKNKKNNINNLVKLVEQNDIKKVVPIENSVISQIKSYTTGSKERSYNPNSAIRNSKIFEIPI